MKNPDWSRDELILALDFYLGHRPKIPDKNSDEVKALSATLRRINAYLGIKGDEKFRNANGVGMKLGNFRRFDPDYKGKGLPRGNQEEETVWRLYADKPEELRKIVSSIHSFASQDASISEEESTPLALGGEEADEGRILTRIHTVRERNAALTERKKSQFKASHGRLFCEVCGFDFESKYGSHGFDFIECHHTRPVSELKAGDKTNVADLVLVCSNCHRMIHRTRPWLGIEDLREKVSGR